MTLIAPGVLANLGIRGDKLSTMMGGSVHGEHFVYDFPSFLTLFASLIGIDCSDERDRKTVLWIPVQDGNWAEVVVIL